MARRHFFCIFLCNCPLFTRTTLEHWTDEFCYMKQKQNCFGTFLLQLRGQISHLRLNCLITTYNTNENHRRLINEHDFYVILNASIFFIKSIDRLFMLLFISLIWAGKWNIHRSYVKPYTKTRIGYTQSSVSEYVFRTIVSYSTTLSWMKKKKRKKNFFCWSEANLWLLTY